MADITLSISVYVLRQFQTPKGHFQKSCLHLILLKTNKLLFILEKSPLGSCLHRAPERARLYWGKNTGSWMCKGLYNPANQYCLLLIGIRI